MKILTNLIVVSTLTCFLTLSNIVFADESVKLFSPEKEAKLIALLKKASKEERDPILTYLLFNQFELSDQQKNPLSWDATAWIGRDAHKIYFRTEGENVSGKTDSENQLLYSHPILPFWDIQAGLTFDQRNEFKNQNWAAVGIQGLAPYFFDTSTYLLLNKDNVGIRFDGEFDFKFTQRLILTPQIKFNYYAKDQPLYGVGSGLSSSELGIRLRYELNRKLAPYVGVKWQKKYGTTAQLANNYATDVSLVAGVRFWL